MEDLRKWRHALELANSGTFARASRALRLTQPALTRSIQSLEQQLGLPLFERLSSGVRVTAGGRELLDHARIVLNQAGRLRQRAEQLRTGDRGKVAFGITPMLAPMLNSLVEEWAREAWDIELRLYVQTVPGLTDLLLNDQLDFFIGDVGRARYEGLSISEIRTFEVAYYVRAGHPLLQSTEISADDVAELRTVAPEFSRNRHPGEAVTMMCEEVNLLKAAALAGDAILVGMAPALERELAQGQLVQLPIAPSTEMACNVGTVSLVGSPSSAVRQVTGRIKNIIRDWRPQSPLHPSPNPCVPFVVS